MASSTRLFMALALPALLAGCKVVDPVPERVCTLELRSTIQVNVTDARTGAPAAIGSTVIVRGGSVYDSVVVTGLAAPAPAVAYVGWEDRIRAGRYTVEVRKPGYVPFSKSDVDVTSDECHSGPGPRLDVALQPVP